MSEQLNLDGIRARWAANGRMSLVDLAFQCVDAIRAADYPHETRGPDAMLDCIDMDAAHASQMLDAYEKEHDNAIKELTRLTARVAELEAERQWTRVVGAPKGEEMLLKVCWKSDAGPEERRGRLINGRWWVNGWGWLQVADGHVSHYMPLPAPPETTP